MSDLYEPETRYVVAIFIEGGLKIPFNMSEQEVNRVARYLRRWPIFRPRTLELSTSDNQTRLFIDYSRILSVEVNDEAYMARLNSERERLSNEMMARANHEQ